MKLRSNYWKPQPTLGVESFSQYDGGCSVQVERASRLPPGWLWILALVLAVATVIVVVVLTVGHSRSRARIAGQSEALAGELITSPVGAYRTGPDSVNGPLDLRAAATATVVPQGQLQRVLDDHHLLAAYSRVWTNGADFQSAVAFRFKDQGGTQALENAVLADVRSISSGAVFPLPGVPGVLAFTVPSRRSDQKASIFCQGAFLVDGKEAFQLLECTAAPPSLATLQELARGQVERLGGAAQVAPSGSAFGGARSTALRHGVLAPREGMKQ